MGNVNRKYTKEFKDEAVHLALKSPAISQVAKSLGIPAGTLYSWVEQLKQKDSISNTTNRENDASVDVSKLEENRRLHKELMIARKEKEILKKAAAYFAQHQQ